MILILVVFSTVLQFSFCFVLGFFTERQEEDEGGGKRKKEEEEGEGGMPMTVISDEI